MKTFFETVRESIWDPKFYAVMDRRTTREALNYFLSLLFVTSFVSVAAITIFAAPAGLSFLNQVVNFTATKYPADLTVTLQNGTASTTPARIRVFAPPPEFFSVDEITALSTQGVNNILVVDTQSGFENRTQFDDAKTLALLTKDSLVVKKNGGFEVNPLPKNFNLVIDKPFVERWLAKTFSIVRLILPLLVAFGFLVSYIIRIVTYLIAAVFASLVLWAISSLVKRKAYYWQFFNTALYAVTLPILLDLALFMLGWANGLHYLTTILLTVAVWAFNVKIWIKPNLPSTNVTEPSVKK